MRKRAFVFATGIVQSLFYLNPKVRVSAIFCLFTARFVSDLVGKPEDRVSHNEAHIFQMITEKCFVHFLSKSQNSILM